MLELLASAQPTIEQGQCKKCGKCTVVCPSGFLAFEDGALVARSRSFMGCIGCGHCEMVCPVNCIKVSGRQRQPEDITPLVATTKTTATQFEALLLGRRSRRAFQKREVPAALVQQILQAVETAPMGIPPSPVGVVVVSGCEKVQQFVEAAAAGFRKVLPFLRPPFRWLLRLFMKKTDYDFIKEFAVPLMQTLLSEAEEGRDALCYQAPLLYLFHAPAWAGQVDATIATTYAMLAAEAAGLGTIWIGSLAGLNRVPEFKRRYNIPQDHQITGLLACGYSAVTFERSIRRRLASVSYA